MIFLSQKILVRLTYNLSVKKTKGLSSKKIQKTQNKIFLNNSFIQFLREFKLFYFFEFSALCKASFYYFHNKCSP